MYNISITEPADAADTTVDLLVCKICESKLDLHIFGKHSSKCLEVAELKEKISEQAVEVSNLVDKAYNLRNQLNTSFAIQRMKWARSPHHKRSSPMSKTGLSSNTPKRPSQCPKKFMFDETEHEEHSSLNSIKIELTDDITIDEYQGEFQRGMAILKSILHYGHSFNSQVSDESLDPTGDFRIRNEVNLAYIQIKDKQISEYLQTFHDCIQKLVRMKQDLMRKLEELEKINTFQTKSDSESSVRSRPAHSQERRTSCFKSHRIVSLDDSDASDSSIEKRSRSSLSVRWRRGTVSSPLQVLRQLHDGKTLSRFASPYLKDKFGSSSPSKTSLPEGTEKSDKVVKGVIPKSLLKAMNAISGIFFRFEVRRTNKLSFTKACGKNKESAKKKISFNRTNTLQADSLERRDSRKPASILDLVEEPKPKARERIWSWDNIPRSINFDLLLDKKKTAKGISFVAESAENADGSDLQLRSKVSSILSSDSSSGSTTSIAEDKLDKVLPDHNDPGSDVFDGIQASTMRGYYSDSDVNKVTRVDIAKYSFKNTGVTIDDFKFMKYIGEGAYGKIYLVKKKATGDQYAMKIVNYLDRETTHNQVASLRAERDIYKSIKGDWVVKAYYTFIHKNCVCFALEYMLGGDLQGLVEQAGCLDESAARFYFAELILAVESLHSLGIVHRDLKPDNILIDANGHIKLTDFGLSEKGLQKFRKQTSTKFRSTVANISLAELNTSIVIHDNSASSVKSGVDRDKDSSLDCCVTSTNRDAVNFSELIQRLETPNWQKQSTLEETYLIKNKSDEEAIFSFPDSTDQNSWMLQRRLRRSETVKKREVYRIVGTPDYMAPEILSGKDCSGKGIDLWSLGVILYEFLVGVPPFNDDSVDKIFANILEMKMEWPAIGRGDDCLSPEAYDLIKNLMNKDPSKRLNIDQIKKHAFFKGLDWGHVLSMKAPFIPQKKDCDTQSPTMTLPNIFKDKPEEATKLRVKGSFAEDMMSFNMKRVDLLYQLNQNEYQNHIQHAMRTKSPQKSNCTN